MRGDVPQRIYHAISRGYVLSQILLRVDPLRRTVGEWFSQELCGPLGAAFFCGPSDPRYADKPEAAMVRPERPYLFANGMVPQAVRAALPEKFPVRCSCPVLLLPRPAVPCPVLSVAAATSCSSMLVCAGAGAGADAKTGMVQEAEMSEDMKAVMALHPMNNPQGRLPTSEQVMEPRLATVTPRMSWDT